uniref:Uncharacterized protein n=1 Tax=Echeneis naucrates TaxID=173247 RepID=A0A665UM17_ECHNA
ITREASFRALEAFISPSAIRSSSALFTFALASRLASASAAMALCSCWGNLTSLISTRSTLIPHGSVASSRASFLQGFWCQARSSGWFEPAGA